LAAEGATAIVCDQCANAGRDEKDLKYFCVPDAEGNYVRGRAPISELDGQPEWKHEMSRHAGD
jgi:hypothetical protein